MHHAITAVLRCGTEVTLAQLTADLHRRIASDFRRAGHRIIVGLDGPDCSGKTTLCGSLVMSLKRRYSVLPVHFDDYLNSKRKRHQRGSFSSNGFRYDYFDAESLCESVLEPMCGNGRTSGPNVVIVEGLFLFTKSLKSFFDLRIRLEISEALLLERALARDSGRLGSSAWVHEHYMRQCIPAQRQYRRRDAPGRSAHYRISVFGDDRYEVRRKSA